MSDRLSNEHDHDVSEKLDPPGTIPAGPSDSGNRNEPPNPRAVPSNEGGDDTP